MSSQVKSISLAQQCDDDDDDDDNDDEYDAYRKEWNGMEWNGMEWNGMHIQKL